MKQAASRHSTMGFFLILLHCLSLQWRFQFMSLLPSRPDVGVAWDMVELTGVSDRFCNDSRDMVLSSLDIFFHNEAWSRAVLPEWIAASVFNVHPFANGIIVGVSAVSRCKSGCLLLYWNISCDFTLIRYSVEIRIDKSVVWKCHLAKKEEASQITRHYRFGSLLYSGGFAMSFVSEPLSIMLFLLLALFFSLRRWSFKKSEWNRLVFAEWVKLFILSNWL